MRSFKRCLLAVSALTATAVILPGSIGAAPLPSQAVAQLPAQTGPKVTSRQDKGSAGRAPQAATGQIKIPNIRELCRIREREILFHAATAFSQTTNFLKEAEPARKAELLNELTATKQIATDVESSWQRLNCSLLIYGSQVAVDGR